MIPHVRKTWTYMNMQHPTQDPKVSFLHWRFCWLAASRMRHDSDKYLSRASLRTLHSFPPRSFNFPLLSDFLAQPQPELVIYITQPAPAHTCKNLGNRPLRTPMKSSSQNVCWNLGFWPRVQSLNYRSIQNSKKHKDCHQGLLPGNAWRVPQSARAPRMPETRQYWW